MGFILNDRNQYYDILKAHSSEDLQLGQYKALFEQAETINKDVETYAEQFPELDAGIATGLSILGVPPSFNAVRDIAQQSAEIRVENEAKVWQELQEKYQYKHTEDNMKMTLGDLLTAGIAPGGAKPGDVQYGVWLFGALEGLFQTFGPSGKWSIIGSAVNALTPGQPMTVGRSQAYLRDLKAYDKLVRDGFTPLEAQNKLSIDLSGTKVDNIGQDTSGFESLQKQIDMIKEAHDLGGEPVIANMWRQVVQGKPINFDRGTKVTLESVKAENTPYYEDLITNYGLKPSEASAFIYKFIGEPVKDFDENGELHYTSTYNPNQINFYAGRARQRYFWAGQTTQDYYRPEWAKRDILLEYSPGKVSAAEIYEPGTKAFNTLSGIIDFSYQLAPEIVAGRGARGIGNLFRSLRGPNKAFELMQQGRIRQSGKTININPRSMADDLLEDIGSEIDGATGTGNINKFMNRFGGNKKLDTVVPTKKNAVKHLKKIKKQNTLFGRVPRFFQATKDDILNQPTNKALFQALADTKVEDLYFLATNPITKILPPQVQATIIKESDPVKIEKIFNDMLGTGYSVLDEAGQLTPYVLPNQILPKTGSLVLNKFLRQTGINRNAQYRTFGSYLGDKARPLRPRNIRQTIFGTKSQKQLIRLEDASDEIIDKMDNVAKYIEEDIPKELQGKLPEFERFLGFSSNFNSSYDPYFRKMLSVIPDVGIPLNNLSVGYKQLASHLAINEYSPNEASRILDEFLKLDFMDKPALRTFAREQGYRDAQLVKAKGGNFEYVAKAATDLFDGDAKIKLYATGKSSRVLPNIGTNFKGYALNALGEPVDDFGKGVTTMTASLFSQMQDNIAPLLNYKMINRAMKPMFKPYETIGDGTFKTTSFKYDLQQYAKYINPWNKDAINPFEKGVINVKRLEDNFLSQTINFYTRNIFKPFVLLRAAFFTRVFLEESARIAVKGLSGIFNKPHEWFMWLSAHNPNSKLGSLLEKMPLGPQKAKYNADGIQMLAEEEFLEATQKSFRYDDFIGSNYKENKLTEYLGKSTADMTIDEITEAVFHELRFIRNDPISRAVAKFGYGTPELKTWLASSAGRQARIDMVRYGGNKYSGILDDSSDLLDQHLQFLESRIRITAGGVVSDGIDIQKQSNGTYKYNLRMDVDMGNKDIRNMIGDGKLQKYGSTKAGDNVEFFSSAENVLKGFKKKKLMDELSKYYNKTDGIDPGTLSVIRRTTQEENPKFLENLESAYDQFLGAAFDKLITKPIGYLNRSTVFKQFRWMYIGNRFEDFTPGLRNKFIQEAIDAAVPKSIIDDLKGQAAIYKGGGIDDYNAMNLESKSYGLAGVKELLYDNRQKHAVSEKVVNIFPFAEIWFEVFQTWGKLLSENPYVLRKAHVAVKGAQGADSLGPSSDDGFFTPDPRDKQQDMFVYPFGGWMSNLIFDDANVDGQSGVKISPRGRVQGVNLLAQGFVPGPNPFVGFGINRLLPKIEKASTVAGAKYGWANDLEEFISGGFPAPEKVSDIFAISPVYKKLRAWTLSDDAFDIISEDSTEAEKMRARATIDIFRWGVSAGEPKRLYDAGKLDSYLNKLYPGSDINDVNQGMLEDAYLEYSKQKSGTLYGFQFIYQFFGPTGFEPEYFIEDTQGALWGRAVLFEEFARLKEKNGDNDVATYNEFFELYGVEYPYLLSSKSMSETGKQAYSERVQKFQKNNAEIFDNLDLSGYYLNIDNPNEEKNWSDIVTQKSQMSPDQYKRNVNDTIGFFRYRTYTRKLDDLNLTSLQKTLLKRLYREELKLNLPGFQSDEYGLTIPVSTQSVFDEMREKWRTLPGVMNLDAGKGFAEAMESWEYAETLSAQYSPTANKNWWLTSDDVRAKSLRIWMYNQANSVIEKYPEFWPVWTGVMLKLYRDDNEYLDYVGSDG